MRYEFTVLISLLSGCGLLPTAASTPPGTSYELKLYPHEVEYELLGQSTANACAPQELLKHMTSAKSPDPRAFGNSYLFEKAKYDAITQLRGADGLVGIRGWAEDKDGQECVTVTGRGYRMLSLRATEGHPPGERNTKPEPKVNAKRSSDFVEPNFDQSP